MGPDVLNWYILRLSILLDFSHLLFYLPFLLCHFLFEFFCKLLVEGNRSFKLLLLNLLNILKREVTVLGQTPFSPPTFVQRFRASRGRHIIPRLRVHDRTRPFLKFLLDNHLEVSFSILVAILDLLNFHESLFVINKRLQLHVSYTFSLRIFEIVQNPSLVVRHIPWHRNGRGYFHLGQVFVLVWQLLRNELIKLFLVIQCVLKLLTIDVEEGRLAGLHQKFNLFSFVMNWIFQIVLLYDSLLQRAFHWKVSFNQNLLEVLCVLLMGLFGLLFKVIDLLL